MITKIVVSSPNWEIKKIKTKKNCTTDKLKFVFIEIFYFVQTVWSLMYYYYCLSLVSSVDFHDQICKLRVTPLILQCKSDHFDPDNKSKSGNCCRSTNLSFFLSFFLSIKAMPKDMDEFWVVLFLGNRKGKKRTDTHIRFGYIEPWSTVLKTQRTSLRIYTKLSVLVGKPWVLLKHLKTSQPTFYFILKKPHLKLFKNLELEVISKSKNHHLNYTGMDYYGLQRVSK